MDLSQLTTALIDDSNNFQLFKELGDYLREDSIRSSTLIVRFIPDLLKISNKNFQKFLYKEEPDSLILENLRVLVNLMANDDNNRQFLANLNSEENTQFWDYLSHMLQKKNEGINQRILIFLNQFINNTNFKNDFTLFFYEIKLDHTLVNFLKKNYEDDIFEIQNPIELYSEIVNDNLTKILDDSTYLNCSIEYIDLFLSIFEQALNQEINNNDVEEIDEGVLYLSNILTNLTLFEDLPNIQTINANERILKIIPKIPTNVTNITSIKRKLFSTSGNISSMKTYVNFKDLETSISYLKNPNNDPYLLSACSVNLGNYITNKQTSEKLTNLIETKILIDLFVSNFFNIKFNDVVQYQSFHLLNNILKPSISPLIIQNSNLPKITKLIIDNGEYYKEVLDIYLKFIKRLIRFEFIENKNNVLDYVDLWNIFKSLESNLEREEIYLILSQAFLQNFKLLNHPFLKELINVLPSTTSLSSNIPINFLLEKLKTIAIFNQTLLSQQNGLHKFINTIYGEYDSFAEEFLKPFKEFLVQTNQSLDEDSSNKQLKILLNNSKFVSASSITLLSSNPDPVSEEICQLCQLILARA